MNTATISMHEIKLTYRHDGEKVRGIMIENVIVECTRKDKTFFKALKPVKIGDTLTLTNGYWDEQHEAVSMSHETIYGKEYTKVKFVGKLTQNIRTVYFKEEMGEVIS